MPNKNIVNYEKLKTIFEALWDKIKDQFIKSARLEDNTLKFEKGNGSIVDVDLKPILKANNIDYDDVNTNFGLSNVQEVLEYLEKDKASLTKNNIFTGVNTFNELELTGKNDFVQTGGELQTVTYTVNNYCADRRVSTHAITQQPNPQYVSAIKIEMADTYNVGDMVSGVYVVEMEKTANKLTDIVGDKITEGGTFVVEKDLNNQNIIYVPIEKEYTKDTYFLVGKKGSVSFAQSYHRTDYVDDVINGVPVDSLPPKGSELNHPNSNGWIVRHALTTDTINVRKELEELNSKVDKTDVGNEDNKIPRLENGKLVDDIIPELAITRIVKADTQDIALEMTNDKTIQVGDSIILISDKNKVYQYNGEKSGDFKDRFVPISQGDATVKTINKIEPADGDFEFELEETDTKLNLKVGGKDITEVDFATTTQITELKDLLVFR